MSDHIKKEPALRFKGFTDAWEQRKLGDCIKLLKSGLSRQLLSNDVGVVVIRANNIESGMLNLEKDLKYWYTKDPQGVDINNYLIQKDDILINFINSEAKMGTAAIVDERPKRKVIYTTNILRMITNNSMYNKFFLAHSMTHQYTKFIKSISNSAVNQSSFTTVDFKKYEILLPSIKEQQLIGQIFDSFNHQITLQQRKLDLIKQAKKTLLAKMFPKNNEKVPEFRFKGFTDAWEQRKLGEISKITIGEFVIKTKQNSNSKYPVYNGGINPTGFYDDYNNEGEKILVSARGANAGYVNIVYTRYWAGNSCYSIDINDKKYFDLYYIYQQMKKNQYKFIDTQQAANIPSVSKKEVEMFEILVASSLEQQKIGKFLQSLDHQITLQQRELDLLKTMKKSLLQKMFI